MAKKTTENKKPDISEGKITNSKLTGTTEETETKIESEAADVSHLIDKAERPAHELFQPRERGQIIGKGPSIMGN